MTNDLKNFLGKKEKIAVLVKNIRSAQYESDAIEHMEQWYNNVLDLVDKEVEKRKQEEKEAKPADEIEKIDERAYCAALDDISTIINSLKV